MQKQEPRRVITQPYDYSVQDLVNKIREKDIIISPDYQRNYVWVANDEFENKRSRLIESLLLNIPIPVIYFAEQKKTLTYEVIDGQQRLRTFEDFLNDDFKLKELQIRTDVNGKTYSELEQKDKDEIRKRSIRAIVILNDSDEEVKYEVFERLNLGSVELTPQEIRNNTLRGTFNNLLKELALDDSFRKLIKHRLKSDQNNMAHEELVLRFFAYHSSNLKRSDQLSYFLTKYMEDNRNISDDEALELKILFQKTIKKINKFLGDKAFSIFLSKTNTWNTTTNRLVFEAEMLAFSMVDEEKITITPDQFVSELKDRMINDEKFKRSLGKSGGRKIQERVETIIDLLKI
ncbi:hypothetical protein BMR08_13975 [Methylococcaceae bacterium CS2]|nr:hypothetical protein BMR08_13975 [Methylococcaceae bacterium CS2]